jgi:hypothetical protein
MKALFAVAFIVAACGGGDGIVATPLPTATPSVSLTEPPDVSPVTPSEPREGVFIGSHSGEITFGTDFDQNTLLIIEPLARFSTDVPSIAWSASLSEEVHTAEIDIYITEAGQGTERPISRETLRVSNRQSNRFASKVDLASLVDHKAGTYRMTFIRFDEELAKGTFILFD